MHEYKPQKQFCSLLLLFILPLWANAEETEWTLSGEVLERGTRTPLVGANVFVVDHDQWNAVTDAQGRFTLAIPAAGEYRVNAVAIGHARGKPQAIKLAAGTTPPPLLIYLENNVVLPGVTVTGERNADRVAKTTISGTELERIAGSAGDPLRSLQALPGMVVNDDISAAPAIRGSRPGDNLYYADFLPVPYLFHIGGAVSVFPADLVDDFNLFASSFGPEYGDGIGAVIDVSLRDPRRDRIGGKVNVSFLNTDFLVEGPVNDQQSFLFSVRRSYLDLVIKQVEDQSAGETVEVPVYFDYLGKYLWQQDPDNRFTFYLTGAGDELGFNIKPSADSAIKEPVLAGRSYRNTTYHNQAMVWDRRLNARASNKLALGHNQNRTSSVLGSAGDTRLKLDALYVREQLQYRLGEKHDLYTGGMLQRSNIDINAAGVNPICSDLEPDCDLSGADRTQLKDTFAVNGAIAFVKDRWHVLPRLTLIGGLHFSYEDFLNKRYTEPRLGLEYQLLPDTLFTAGWGRYNQFPEGGQVVENFGNPELGHLRATHSSMGLAHNLGKDWLLKGDVFYKTFDDLVVTDPTVKYINGASGVSYGLELFAQRKDTGPLSGWLAVTAAKAERTIDARHETFPFDYDQPLAATLVLNYRASKRWSYGLTWRYHTGAPYTPVIGNKTVTDPDGSTRIRPVYGETNSRRLPAYHRLDLRVDRDFVYDRFLVNGYVEVGNAYNHKNVSGYKYNPDYTRRKANYQLPLIISFGVQFTF
jgi:hypothetical protein